MKGSVVIAGASEGLGSALCDAFGASGFHVAALGREAALKRVNATKTIACDLTDVLEVDHAFTALEDAIGPPSIVIYNAHQLELRTSDDTSLDLFETVWRVNCFGAYVVAKRALRGVGGEKEKEVEERTLIFTGATASVRGGKRTAAFASSKFALRGLAQSLARELGPSGVHVAHVVLDGLVWSERTRARFSSSREDTSMSPSAVASAYVSLALQDRSAWTHELDLRPYVERF